MLPTYKTGDLLVGWKWFRPSVGQAVIARTDMMLVKRIIRIEAGKVWLEGDNKLQSRDSRRFGYVDIDALEAVILLKISI